MAKRPTDPRSTTDRLRALQAILPDMIDEPPDPSVRGCMRRAARALFADVDDNEERAQCLRAFAEIGLELGVPAALVRDALEEAQPPSEPPPVAPLWRRSG